MLSYFSVLLTLAAVHGAGIQDADGDGFPDTVELRTVAERHSFREWFTWIALQIAYGKLHAGGVNDCASLVATSYREALKRHTLRWARKHGLSAVPPIPDRRHYYYPNVPLLGKRIFRVKPPIDTDDITADFGESATGEYLVKYNLQFVSRRIEDAVHGDILVFYHHNSRMPYHLMIFFRDGLRDMVVYHTGPGGEFRIIPISLLNRHPDPSWHVTEENPSFIGVYRWRILE